MLPVFGQEVEGGQRIAIPQTQTNIEIMAPPALPSGDWRGVSRIARSAGSTERNG